ncbi:MAG: DUF1573 domain-containing protein [Saprospiraceae bacterium]|nr:DUF1573 domain-containing protein [Saprospiraceae bacterium]
MTFRYKMAVVIVGFLFFGLAGCRSAKQASIPNDVTLKDQSTIPPDTLGKHASIVFDSSAYHFGKVIEGQAYETTVYFTNQGPGDLVIELVTACECTKLDYTILPVRVGKRSPIHIRYNSSGKEGPQIVDVDIIANTDPIVSSTKFYIDVVKKN